MKTVLTIAGSDSSGGAGIQADIKTITLNGAFAMSAITAMTAQNTMGVRSIYESSPNFLKDQIDAVFEDIFPDSVKVGMVSSEKLINVIAERLEFFSAANIVVDPVMVSTCGSKLINADALCTLKERLFPISSLITPNIPEAEVLLGNKILNENDMVSAARAIGGRYRCSVLLKGGHGKKDANDLLYHEGEIHLFEGKKIHNPNTHGTGCTLSSAIATNLAKGFDIYESVKRGKEYVSGAISAMLDLGKGSGPMDHGFYLKSVFTEEKEG